MLALPGGWGAAARPMLRARVRRFASSVRPVDAVDTVVCGGGVVGVACAHYLARNHGARVLLVDPRPLLSYTSALSTECYRNYFATHAPMVRSADVI
eukprot:4130932-Prymnesium_polylepis.1